MNDVRTVKMQQAPPLIKIKETALLYTFGGIQIVSKKFSNK